MAERVERLPADWPDGRDVLLVELTDWLWPPEARVEWFTAFIAADARDASDETIRSLATAMLTERCASVSAWGPDCERVHHQFDTAYVEWPSHRSVRRWGRWRTTWSEEIPYLMTTDHTDESLPSALWYAAYLGWPSSDGYYEDRPATFVALVEPPFREEVRDLLLDLEHLTREAEADEDSVAWASVRECHSNGTERLTATPSTPPGDGYFVARDRNHEPPHGGAAMTAAVEAPVSLPAVSRWVLLGCRNVRIPGRGCVG